MKKILALILCLGFGLAFSQTQEAKVQPTADHSRDEYVPEQSKPAEYPGGLSAFMREVSQKINSNKIKGAKSRTSSKAKFSVNAKGYIETIIVTGENESLNHEVERVMKSMKTQWRPGEYKGNPVMIWFTLPFSINFE
jgi:protein TonB